MQLFKTSKSILQYIKHYERDENILHTNFIELKLLIAYTPLAK